ncbi:succinyldiaminopimelate transaminase [Corynebacterium lowii]|uniref:Aminotransferase n=1 Tax=Corynebacterium lowii TaxID=1544413 RepID=A0A0Q1AI58_9CORY|nr:succinyldiaminopimelate transaminase [Corynebacterium lowii]KQB86292.1 Glutamate-pyruvate aminotransferase AlaC [Corynebacterium lowii]MDP9850777.1 succinyldiaminopimelate transaminase [Corynebacterium lowii]
MTRTPLGDTLPDFPWDSLAPAKKRAAEHPEGIVNLSVGSPVDEVAPGIQLALAEAAAYPGYPQTVGTPELRRAIIESSARRYGITELGENSVLPVVGTKEAIAWLPTTLGLGKGDTVVIPELAYPTYEVGARLAGCEVLRTDSTVALGPQRPGLIFLNSPSNPSGRVLGVEHLRKVVEWARERDVIVASDECYLGLGWDDERRPLSLLHPEVCGGDHSNLLVIHSLSKTSNLAGYRAGFFAGDSGLIAELTLVRKHAGLMVPYPIQSALRAALEEDTQEQVQKMRYAARRATLLRAVTEAGFTIEHSEAGLYLWATRGEDCWDTVEWFAERGILVAPGSFYGPSGGKHVRISLTATDERIDAATARLGA